MHSRNHRVEHETNARAALAMLALLVLGLAGCASGLTPKSSHSPVDTAPYVGQFTGEFVDGMPLYRFPTIEVVGSRSDVDAGI